MHGRAVPVDVSSGPLRQALLDVYVPRYGESWASFMDSGPVYARIDAERCSRTRRPRSSFTSVRQAQDFAL